jgi:hypothetical protein
MRERPILFSAPMVLAILAGKKTVTRRIVRAPKDLGFDGIDAARGLSFWSGPNQPTGDVQIRCPYGAVGTKLWVRETLREADGCWRYDADRTEVALRGDDPRVSEMIAWAHHKEGDVCVSIHMPRWASRITLEVTDVRIERLQEIGEDDARAEGLSQDNDGRWLPGPCEDPRWAFRALWEAINGGRAPWAINPWVWAVSFKRVTP